MSMLWLRGSVRLEVMCFGDQFASMFWLCSNSLYKCRRKHRPPVVAVVVTVAEVAVAAVVVAVVAAVAVVTAARV